VNVVQGGRKASRSVRSRLCAALGLGAVLVGAAALAGSKAEAETGTYVLEDIGDFQNPVHVDNAPGFPDLLFVVEQNGVVRVLDNEVEQPQPFLDISGRVASGGEEGLLSIAFHPKYQTNRRFYVLYTNKSAGHDLRVSQFRRDPDDPLDARESSVKKVITVQHNQANNHNGGQLQFGPGGYLYMSTGDGGPQGDPENDAQSKQRLLGKILRIDPKPKGGYSSPPGNPYRGNPGRNQIWARGLRNAWRFSFDADTGALTIGDVGGGASEEIDYEPDGGRKANFGWNDYEGFEETPFGTGRNAKNAKFPIHAYDSLPGGGEAVTGGYVIRDPGLPSLEGLFVYTDYFYGQLRTIDPDAPEPPATDADLPGADPEQPVSSFGEGAGRQIYVVGHGGDVFRLEEAG
jgi:hypothetical protein